MAREYKYAGTTIRRVVGGYIIYHPSGETVVIHTVDIAHERDQLVENVQKAELAIIKFDKLQGEINKVDFTGFIAPSDFKVPEATNPVIKKSLLSRIMRRQK
jgi:hypothetical protein